MSAFPGFYRRPFSAGGHGNQHRVRHLHRQGRTENGDGTVIRHDPEQTRLVMRDVEPRLALQQVQRPARRAIRECDCSGRGQLPDAPNFERHATQFIRSGDHIPSGLERKMRHHDLMQGRQA